MEVCEQCVNDAELVAGIDKDVSFAAAGFDASFASLFPREFERAHGRGTDGDDAVAVRFREINGICGRCGDFVGLAVEFVVLDFSYAHGLEGAEADVESDFRDFNSTGANALENFGREVEARRRRGYRSSRFRIDGLVALAICWLVFAVDVG